MLALVESLCAAGARLRTHPTALCWTEKRGKMDGDNVRVYMYVCMYVCICSGATFTLRSAILNSSKYITTVYSVIKW